MSIPIEDGMLPGDLAVPDRCRGLVLFAHGSGSSRFSPRNQAVARWLGVRHFATLLVDLLTDTEEVSDLDGHLRFDVELLARRLVAISAWTRDEQALSALPVGYFGASTGAGAALIAAAARPELVRAVVSRGGRVDLAGTALRQVVAPTLLMVGERDATVVRLNEEAMSWMRGEVQLAIVPGATHLFEEPGALEQVGELAGRWFELHLSNQ